MSFGKAIAQSAHAIQALLDEGRKRSWPSDLHEPLKEWLVGVRGADVSLSKGARFRALSALPYAADVRDAGRTEVALGTLTVVLIPPGASA